MLTKEEREARMQKRVEAVIKRERAMAYAYSNQVNDSAFCVRLDSHIVSQTKFK